MSISNYIVSRAWIIATLDLKKKKKKNKVTSDLIYTNFFIYFYIAESISVVSSFLLIGSTQFQSLANIPFILSRYFSIIANEKICSVNLILFKVERINFNVGLHYLVDHRTLPNARPC